MFRVPLSFVASCSHPLLAPSWLLCAKLSHLSSYYLFLLLPFLLVTLTSFALCQFLVVHHTSRRLFPEVLSVACVGDVALDLLKHTVCFSGLKFGLDGHVITCHGIESVQSESRRFGQNQV